MNKKLICGVDECSERFLNKKDLKTHLMSMKHRRLTIICPWCPDHSTYRRTSDLRKHLAEEHGEEGKELGKDVCDEQSCFWLAVHPDEYARVMTIPEEESEVGRRLKKQVIAWVGNQSRPLKTKEEWEEGWARIARDQRGKESPPPSKSRRYSPSTPEIGEEDGLVVKDVKLDHEGATALLQGDGLWYQALIGPRILTSPQTMTALTRRMSLLQPFEDNRPKDHTTLEEAAARTRKVSIGKVLGIDPALITEVKRWILPPTHDVLELDDPECVRDLCETGSESGTSEDRQQTAPPPLPVAQPPRHPSPAKRFLSSQGKKRSFSPENRRMSSPSQEEQAANLLSFGVMPLLPAARRDWGDSSIELVVPNGAVSLTWPPKDWRTMSSDQRLLQWEFAALTLERGSRKNVPAVDRTLLRDKYNMLALPGTSVVSRKEEENASNERKARIYLYKTVAAISLKKTDSPTSSAILRMLRDAQRDRDTSTDWIVRRIQAAQVPLRIDVSNY